jgi:hypothetical protein
MYRLPRKITGQMQTYNFTVKISIEGSDRNNAEDDLRDLLDADPIITEYEIDDLETVGSTIG